MSVDPAGTFQLPPPPHAAPPADAPRRALVLFMILSTAAIFVTLFAVLYFRWARAQEPSSMMIVEATPAFDGADVVVDGIALPAPYKVTVGTRSGRVIPFYLDRGSYTLRVSRDAKTIYAADFPLQNNQVVRVDLSLLEHLLPPPATANTNAPDPG
jgi:hypothetical protein